ncbi:hypothetical protein ACOSQ2_013721 [Xanthoceras sorbifolium]
MQLGSENLVEKMSWYLEEGEWNMQKLSMALPWDIVLKICSINAGRSSNGLDSFIWGLGKDGRFSIKTAYEAKIMGQDLEDWEGKFIWKLQLPPKIFNFLWLIFHGKLLTNL